MIDIEIRDINNKTKGKMSLDGAVFSAGVSQAVVHSAVVSHLANQRQGTHATKTKGLVSGGGKKPYKQKGTGRARAGSTRSPLWRHGGTVFGPLPRDYSYSLPKKAKRAALAAALAAKVQDNRLVLLDKLELAAPRTKEMAGLL